MKYLFVFEDLTVKLVTTAITPDDLEGIADGTIAIYDIAKDPPVEILADGKEGPIEEATLYSEAEGTFHV